MKDISSSNKNKETLIEFLSGILGGFSSLIVGYPLE